MMKQLIHMPMHNLTLAMTTLLAACGNGGGSSNSASQPVADNKPIIKGVWTQPQVIGLEENTNTYKPKVGIDKAGNAVVVWGQSKKDTESSGIRHKIKLVHYGADNGWEDLKILGPTDEADNFSTLYRPNIAMNEQGDFLATWSKRNKFKNWHSMGFRASTENKDGHTCSLAVGSKYQPSGDNYYTVLDAQGDPIVIAAVNDYTHKTAAIVARYCDAELGWNNVQQIATLTSPATRVDLQLATNAQGRAIATWISDADESNNKQLMGSYYINDGWGEPTPIAEITTDLRLHKTVIDDAGHATTVWQNNGQILYSRYSPLSSGWSTGVLLAEVDSATIDLATSAKGAMTLAWANANDVMARTYTISSGEWSAPEFLAQEVDTTDETLRVVMDTENNAVAVWQNEGEIMASRYTPDKSWNDAYRLNEEGTVANSPSIAVNAFGQAVVAWDQNINGYSAIWASFLK